MKYLFLALLFVACSNQSPTKIVEEKIVYKDTSYVYEGIIDSGINCIDCCPNRLMLSGVDSGLIPDGKIFLNWDEEWIVNNLDTYRRVNDSLIVSPVNCRTLNGHKFKIILVKE